MAVAPFEVLTTDLDGMALMTIALTVRGALACAESK
jgi:hypothetical protein